MAQPARPISQAASSCLIEITVEEASSLQRVHPQAAYFWLKQVARVHAPPHVQREN